MTVEQAQYRLELSRETLVRLRHINKSDNEAFDMAIQALQAQANVSENPTGLQQAAERVIEKSNAWFEEQEQADGDYISRQAAIDALEYCDFTKSVNDGLALYKDSVIEALKDLPSVAIPKERGE